MESLYRLLVKLPAAPGLLGEFIASHAGQRLFLWALIALTIVLRVPFLEELPPGLHGDEGWTGMDANQILLKGWIGPYVTSALGQPAGPLYWSALIFRLTGEQDSVFVLRLSMSLLACLTVILFWRACAKLFPVAPAMVASLLLCLSLWHLHYSRMGFMVIACPLLEVATLYFLALSYRSGSRLLYFLSGIVCGLGMYTYNSYVFFPLALFASLFLHRLCFKETGLNFVKQVLMWLGFTISAGPFVFYIASRIGFAHQNALALWRSAAWLEEDLIGRLHLLCSQLAEFFMRVFVRGYPDASDGAGVVPLLGVIALAFMVIGGAVALRRLSDFRYAAILSCSLIIPLGSILSSLSHGSYRRSLGALPFFLLLETIGIVWTWQKCKLSRHLLTALLRTALTGLVLYSTLSGTFYYFSGFRKAVLTDFVFCTELVSAIRYIKALPDNPIVYFYSDRWGYGYESRLFLAPNSKGFDRSKGFGGDGKLNLVTSGPVVYIFLEPYLPKLEEVKILYPGGTAYQGYESGRPAFSAYHLSAGQTALYRAK